MAVLAGVLVVVCCGGAGAVVVIARRISAGTAYALTRDASDQLEKTPALHVTVDYLDQTQRLVHGAFTVAADRYATGTITDPTGGRADLIADARTTVIRGDADWWARRAPTQVGQLVGRWVRPNPGVALPVDVVGDLNPATLASFLRALSAHATVDKTPDTSNGRSFVTVTSGSWTALLGANLPHELLWFGSPVSDGRLIRPVLSRQSPVRPGPVLVADPIAQPPYVAIAPQPASAADGDATRTAVAKILPQASPGRSTAGAPASAGSSATAAPPPAQADLATKFPAFKTAINATTCTSPICTWTVGVTNTGSAPGEATVYASATPGMPVRALPLGTVAPGATVTTPTLAFNNPARPPAPGQTTQVTVQYEAWVYSPELDGPDAGVAQRLRQRGIDPTTDLPRVHPAYQPTVLAALEMMIGPGPNNPAHNQEALDGLANAVRVGLLPELKALVESRRLLNPLDLPIKLKNVDVNSLSGSPPPRPDQIGYRREVEQAAEILRAEPTAEIIVDGYLTNPQTGEKEGADILNITNKRAYQLKAVSSSAVVSAVGTAVSQLNGTTGIDLVTGVRQKAPPDYFKIAQIYVEPTSARYHQKNRDELVFTLRRDKLDEKLCLDHTPQIDLLVIVNAQGIFQWTKEQLGEFGPACP